MKKIFNYIICLIAVLFFSSCEKFLTQDDPANISEEQWWQKPADATNALAQVYPGLIGGIDILAATNSQMTFSAISDEAVVRGHGGWGEFARGQISPSATAVAGFWRNNYRYIRLANRFLENVDRVVMPDQEEYKRTRMKNEARALRAIYHMELMQLYGEIPIVTKVLTPENNQMSKNTIEEVVQFLKDELTACALDLPPEYDANERHRISSNICYAYLSRLGLFSKDYQLTIDASREIIDSEIFELHRSTSINVNSYAQLFTYAALLNKERIMFKAGGAKNAWINLAPQSIKGQTYVSPTSVALDVYETRQGKTITELGADSIRVYGENPNFNNNRDPRLTASIILPSSEFGTSGILDPFTTNNNSLDRVGLEKSTATGYWVKKYLDPQDMNGTRSLDFMNIRYAEILLNYVEALIENGEWSHADVVIHLNDIRSRAGMPFVEVAVYNNQTMLRDLVRRERQVELAFEGQRYFDIRRWGIGEAVMDGQVYGAWDPRINAFYKVESRGFTERDYLWPLPTTEVSVNKNIKQNDGY